MSDKILDITKVHEVHDYPYGSLRCTAFFSTEFVLKKGFRHVFQTINPKTKRLNAPKKSVYSPFGFNFVEGSTGHIKNGSYRIDSFESINKTAAFIAANYEVLNLTAEMQHDIYNHMFNVARITSGYAVSYGHITKDQLTPLIDATIKTILDGFKNNTNVFEKIIFDVAAINSFKPIAA
jgi:hypothetical protein